MNGITVIAGENDTGKSTFGKVLYCMFNTFCDAESKILSEQTFYFRYIFNTTQHDICPIDDYFSDSTIAKFIKEAKDKKSNEFSSDNILKIITEAIPEQFMLNTEGHETWVDDIKNALTQSLTVSDQEIQKAIIGRYFGTEFEKKVNHANKPNSTGNISLTLQGKSVDISIKNNICCAFDKSIDIIHKAIYVDTPFVIDDIEETRAAQSFPPFSSVVSNPPFNHRQNLRYRLGQRHSNNSIIEEVITNRKITNGLSNIFSIANGEFVEDINGLMFRKNDLKEPIPLSDVSAGIKTFLIIKRLLELGEIKERDILIFDEPEIHLHPSLQLKFAEVLVLLQKEFNVTILLATHSPYFLNAVEAYSKKHSITERVKYYLAESNGDTSDVRDVTGSTDAIYQQLAQPFRKLDTIEDED